MNVKLQFAEDVERLLQAIAGGQFAGIVEYAKQVGSVGSLEQAATEAESRLDKAKRDLTLEDQVWKDTQAQWLAACDKMKQDADAYAAKIKADADVVATKVTAQAQESSAKVLSAAQATANDLAGKISQAKNDLNDLQGMLSSAKDKLSALNIQIMDKTNTLNDVTAKHAAFMKSIGA
jgi:chromosome segregation ATPase